VLFFKFIVFTATINIVHFYCVLCGVDCGYSNRIYSAMVLSFVWILLCYSNSRFSAMVLCCVWRLLLLQQLKI